MKIALFVVGSLILLLVLCISWGLRTNKKLASFEAQSFRDSALRAKDLNDWAVMNVYASDAERSQNPHFPWVRLIAALIGIGLMLPQLIS